MNSETGQEMRKGAFRELKTQDYFHRGAMVQTPGDVIDHIGWSEHGRWGDIDDKTYRDAHGNPTNPVDALYYKEMSLANRQGLL